MKLKCFLKHDNFASKPTQLNYKIRHLTKIEIQDESKLQ
jgi:hypothetical protein